MAIINIFNRFTKKLEGKIIGCPFCHDTQARIILESTTYPRDYKKMCKCKDERTYYRLAQEPNSLMPIPVWRCLRCSGLPKYSEDKVKEYYKKNYPEMCIIF